MKKVIVVGSGFTGLVTAFYLKRQGWNVEVFEKSPGPGGLISSEQTPWGLVESAANGLISSARVEELFRQVGLEPIPTRKESRKRFIYRQGLRQWPLSFKEGHRLFGFFMPRYLFWRRSLKPMTMETLARWGERVLGAEATQYLVSPASQGIYAGDPTRLSASLVLRRMFAKKPRQKKPRVRGTVAPIKGMGQLISHLHAYLEEEGVQFHFNRAFDWSQNKKSPVVICTSADQAAELLKTKAPALAQTLRSVEMLPMLSVTLFYDKREDDAQGFGCLFPRSEGIDVLGVLFNEQIFPERSECRSETWIFGGAQRPDVCSWSEDYVLSKVKVESMKFLGYARDPLGFRIHRWPRALPHYTTELEAIVEKMTELPRNVFLMGNYMGDIGLSQLLDRASQFAERMAEPETENQETRSAHMR